jgi:uncharacterized protein (TIGR03083 family)
MATLAEMRQSILDAHGMLEATLNSLEDEDWQKLSPNEGWTAKDTLAHLCTIGERQRAQIGAIKDGGEFPMEDVNDFNARKVTERRGQSAQQLREELGSEQAATLELLDRVQDADLAKTFDHPTRGAFTIERVCQTMANHVRTHAQDIAAVRNP